MSPAESKRMASSRFCGLRCLFAHDETLHDLASDLESATSSQDSEVDAEAGNPMDWVERLIRVSPTSTPVFAPVPQQIMLSTADMPSWQRSNRNWVEQHLWLIHLRSRDRSLLERSLSFSDALWGQQIEQRTNESGSWLEVQRAGERLEDIRVRAVQLREEMTLFLEGWMARRDAEARLVRQRSDEEQPEGGEDVAEEDDAREDYEGEEEQSARSRSEQLEGRERIEETRAEMKALSIGSRRVSDSSFMSFLDLSSPSS
ncbi:hypothetical protein BDV97DRAFT_373761 [Delphinella strobiligena]|nr:hypothetical protein BDV97DRAFT_373761 [Delphinella strobiligena]